MTFSPDGKFILIGCKDGTAKVLDLKGKVIQTFSVHTFGVTVASYVSNGKYILLGGQDGKTMLLSLAGKIIQTCQESIFEVTAATLSPDSAIVMVANTAGKVILWDRNGKKIRSFTTGKSAAFSPDGKFVLTGGIANSAVLWDLNGKKIASYKGHSSRVNTVAFSPDQQLIFTGNENNGTRLWDLSGKTSVYFPAGKGTCPVAFSPDGAYILTGGSGKNAKLWSRFGKEVQSFIGHSSRINAVVFSRDGKSILTGSNDNTAKLWDLSGREIRSFKTGANVTAVSFSSDSVFVLTANDDNMIQQWPVSGQAAQSFKGGFKKASALAFSPDGKFVLTGGTDAVFGNGKGKTAQLWDITGHEIKSLKGHKRELNAVAFSLDGKLFLTGSDDQTVKLWDSTGIELQSFLTDGAVTSVSISADQKYIVAGSNHHTTKIWDRTGKQLATLIALDSTDWVVTTPTGLFDASPGAMKLMHYVQGLEVIGLNQLKERYYEPNLLAKIIGTSKGELHNAADFGQVALYPEIKASLEKDQLVISLLAREGGMGKLSLFLNGREMREDINPQRLATLRFDLNLFSKYYQPEADNTIALLAYNADGWLKSQAYELTYRAMDNKANNPSATTQTTPFVKTIPRLYAVVVGTSNYAGERLDLRFADQDAKAMAQGLTGAGGALFGADRTTVRLLSTEGKTPAEVSSKANIRQAFADIAAKAMPSDVLVVYFSGHGLAYGAAEKEQFYYLTKDIGSEDIKDPAVREQSTISSNEFTQWLTAIPALKQVMVLDACNAGQIVESFDNIAKKALDPSQIRALDRMKDRTGMFILTGAAADKVSYEASQYGQGLLTYSLLQGMSGLALTEDKRVDVMRLFQYSRDQVPELAKGIGGVQTPVLAFPTDGSSFDIGIVNAGVKIPVAQVKPVFIRNVFQEETSFDDVLGLTDALEAHLRKLTLKGAQADLIYVDVKEYDNAFSLKGRYTVAGDAVTVRGKLYRGKDPKGDFQVTGKKGDVPGLAQLILEKVRGML